MTGAAPKSYTFRREREAGWQELEELIRKADHRGLRSLDADELYQLPALYRGALSSLSVARAISLDRNVIEYLESLAARAYVHVYGAKRNYLESVAQFFARGFPAAVRRMRWSVAVAAAVLLLGLLCGHELVRRDPDLYYSFVAESVAEGRSPASSPEELLAVLEHYRAEGDALTWFATMLFTHNAQIGMACFALGFAAGLPVAILLFANGLMVGALAAVYQQKGLAIEFWAWILPHGVTELLAIVLCAGAGLTIARSLLLPGDHSRVESLARAGREAATVVLGALLLFFLAGLIEGYFRQLVVEEMPRFLVAGASALFWTWYFGFRSRAGDAG